MWLRPASTQTTAEWVTATPTTSKELPSLAKRVQSGLPISTLPFPSLWSPVWYNQVPTVSPPETHSERQATQHDCQLSWLGDGDTWIEKTYFVVSRLEQPRQDKIFFTGMTSPTNQPRKGPFQISIALFELPFTSVSTVRRGHLSLISLISTLPLDLLSESELLICLFFSNKYTHGIL